MVAAIAFLAIWWTRTIVREHRAVRRRHAAHRRRHPGEHRPRLDP
jgi:hypothetical protein